MSACQPSSTDAAGPPRAAAPTAASLATAPPGPAPLVQSEWPLPTPERAAQPDLIVAPDGTLVLSWIESAGKRHTLRLATRAPGASDWSTPITVASGDDWFVNWADTPHVAMTADGALWSHWLQKSAAATYAYDVALVRSADGGRTWTKPVLVNTDGTPTEHGFVSLWVAGPERVGVAWLDGRHTVFGKVLEGQAIVDSVKQGDVIHSITLEGDTDAVLAAQAERVAEWNKLIPSA